MNPTIRKCLTALLLLTSTTTAVNAMSTKECNFLNDDQKAVVTRAYQLGEDIDYGMTFAAIALTESNAGENLINKKSGDYGVFQNNLKYTVRSLEQIQGRKMTRAEVNNLRSNLITNMELSASMAQVNIDFWKKVHGDESWSKIIASYNAGYNYSGSKGQEYLTKVKTNLRKLKNCDCIER